MDLGSTLNKLKEYIDQQLYLSKQKFEDLFIKYKTKEVAEKITDIVGVYNKIDKVEKASDNIDNINNVGSNIESVKTTSKYINNINTNANAINDIKTVSNSIENVNITAKSIDNVNTYAKTYLGSKNSVPSKRNDGTNLEPGDLYYDTNTKEMKYYSGSEWLTINKNKRHINTFTADGNTNSFEVSGGYVKDYTDVYLNGVNVTAIVNMDDNKNIVFPFKPNDGDDILVIAFETFALPDAITKTGDNSINGDLIFNDENKGVILNDRSNDKKWRLLVDDGNLQIEEV